MSSCISMPEVGGQPSILYQQALKELKNDRPLVNYIYARYLMTGVADAMDKVKDSKGNPKYVRNAQGQHSYKDIAEFFDIKQMRRETNSGDVILDAVDLGVADKDFNYIDFTDFEEAYSKAMSYNSSHTGRLAYVVQIDDVFNVVIEDLNAGNQYRKHLVEAQRLSWDTFKTSVISAGVNIDELKDVAEELLTPINVVNFLDTLHLLRNSANNTLSIKDIKIFLTLGKSIPQVQSLLSRGWGTLDEIAQRCYNALNTPGAETPHVMSLINNALNEAKSRVPFDPKAIRDNINNNILPTFEASSDAQKIQDILVDLELKYNIGNKDITRETKKIKAIEDAVVEAIVSLERQIRVLEERGNKSEVKKLQKTKETLAQELRSKQYFFGLTMFLDKALQHTKQVRDILHNIPNTGNRLQHIRDTAEAVSKASSLRDSYYHIVEALTNIESLIITENLSKADRDAVQQKAKEIKELLDTQQKLIETYQERALINCMGEYLGEDSYLGGSYADIVQIMKEDVGIFDFLYSVGKSSNDVIATAGTIVREAQIERDEKTQEISIRIQKATKKLYDSGSDSYFMYDSKGRLITKEGVDWEAYDKARRKEFSTLISLGFKGTALADALESWEENNTIEKVVDAVSGRTERIPDSKFRLAVNPYNHLTTAQQEYYNTMMQIKGEMETLLPKSAQHIYTPVQKRKDWLQVLGEGIQGRLSAKDVALSLLDRMRFWKIREDDVDYITGIKHSDYDNTPSKVIPVAYQTKVAERDLLHNFSASVQALASTALNFDAMSKIQSTIELIQDVVNRMGVSAQTSEGKPVVDVVHTGDKHKKASDAVKKIVIKMLGKQASASNASAILEAYVEMQMYNKKFKGSAKLNKWVNELIGYNSVVRLAANVTGATANIIQGDLQMLIEAGGGKYYNLLHLTRAHARMFGDLTGRTYGKIWDNLSGGRNNIDTLIGEFFDSTNDLYTDKSSEGYYTNPFRRLFGGLNTMALYEGGEYLIRTINMYAILYKEKVSLNGKEIPLIDAFTRTDKENGISDLKLKDGVTKLDGSPLTLEDDYFKRVKLRIKGAADDCFGSMNSEDKGVITQHFLGRMAMNFRQWMVGHYSRRYRARHWDYQQQRWVEGYWRTVFRFIKGYKTFLEEYNALEADLKEDVKANCRKAATEFFIWAALLLFNFGFGDEDDDETWWQRWSTLLLKRSLSEASAGLPIGFITESYRITQNPLPPLVTVTGLLYPFTGIIDGDLFSRNEFGEITWTKIESGRYEGWNKYLRNLLWYTVPFYKQIDQLSHLTEEDAMYQVYERTLK